MKTLLKFFEKYPVYLAPIFFLFLQVYAFHYELNNVKKGYIDGAIWYPVHGFILFCLLAWLVHMVWQYRRVKNQL